MKDSIQIINATKTYGRTTVLNHISLSFEEGKIHGIIGRNGSGKTVLLKCICGFTPLSEGEIFVFGKKVGTDIDILQNAGIILETPGFLSGYSGYQNLKFLAVINNKISNQEILTAMQTVGLDAGSKKKVGKYSLGMKQRLGIAQAIMEKPDILILDEPMNGLDNSGVKEIRSLLLNLKNQGKTIIITSHNKEDIEILCDTVAELDCGDLIDQNIYKET